MNATNPIVIIGGGFGGLSAALTLNKSLGHNLTTPVFLVDPSPYHVYSPSLHESVHNHIPKLSAVPFDHIFEGTHIRHIQDEVIKVDLDAKTVTTANHKINYGDLILALGSKAPTIKGQPNDSDEAYFVQSTDDIVTLRNHIESCLDKMSKIAKQNALAHFVVVGGGASGVEYAAQLQQFLATEASYHEIDKDSIQVTLVDAKDRLLPNEQVETRAYVNGYLRRLGVRLRLGTEATWKEYNEIMGQNSINQTHTVIWAIGALPHPLIKKIKGLRHDENGRVLVDAILEAIDAPNVWVVGDNASVGDSGATSAAIAHGRHVARAISDIREGKIARAYTPQSWPLIIPLSSTFGVAQIGKTVLTGWPIIVYKRWLDLRYYLSILPIPVALHYWWQRGLDLKKDGILTLETHTSR